MNKKEKIIGLTISLILIVVGVIVTCNWISSLEPYPRTISEFINTDYEYLRSEMLIGLGLLIVGIFILVRTFILKYDRETKFAKYFREPKRHYLITILFIIGSLMVSTLFSKGFDVFIYAGISLLYFIFDLLILYTYKNPNKKESNKEVSKYLK